jgi:hypothetical protein
MLSELDGRQAYAIHWEPPPEDAYKWKNKSPKVPKSLRIYEAHIGISGSEPKISSFNDFTDKVSLILDLKFIVKLLCMSSVYKHPLNFYNILNAGSPLHKRSWIQYNPVDWSC